MGPPKGEELMGRITDDRTDDWEDLQAGFSPDDPVCVLTDIHGCCETMMRLWWQSGNIVFAHAGLPRWEGRKWLSLECDEVPR